MERTTKLFKLGAAGAIAVSLAFAAGTTTNAETITAVMRQPMRTLDPVITTAYIVRNYGYMIYDTLLSLDAKGDIKPQMAEKWQVSEDGKTYTFTLRPGLKWDDGSPVTAADCIASIKRWSSTDSVGQIMASLLTSIDQVDDRTFSLNFKVRTGIALQALSKYSSKAPFIMPKKVAETPVSKAITESIGSGPFKFVKGEFKPGIQTVYVKNKDYAPRMEAPSGLAGGHVVKVDGVRWITLPDAMTSINAIKSGEVDFIELLPYDLLPLLEQDKNIQLIVSKSQGGMPLMRLNHLIPPFNNKKIRQAALAAIDQKEIMQADVGSSKYYSTCASVYGCESPFTTTAGAEHLVKADPELSKKLLKEGNYDGTPVVIMRPTDYPNGGGSFVPVIAQQLRKGGFNVQIQAVDWQTEIQRRATRKPVSQGGWNIATTTLSFADLGDPLSNYSIAANGEKAWFGWPNNPQIEELRHQFAVATDLADQKRIATEIQKLALDDVEIIPLGEFSVVSAARKSLNGILKTPLPVFWNITKTKD